MKEKFERKKGAKEIVAGELGDLLGKPVTVRSVVTGQYEPPVSQANIDIDDFSALAQELGGVVRDK